MSDMAKQKKKTVSLGGVLTLLGCIIRAAQLTGAYFGAEFVTERGLYISMLCLLCGGFAILAYEKKGRASFCAVAASAVCLLSTVMGNMSDGGDFLRILSAVFLVATFALAGLHCIFASDGNKLKLTGGVAVFLLAVLCGLFAFGVSISPAVTLVTLLAAYLLTGVSILI